jgi:hypothetical protein
MPESHLPASQSEGLENFAGFYLRFRRFFRDVVGVALVSFALMSLIAIWGMTDGVLITPFAGFLSLWFGWGSYIIILGIAYLGVVLLRHGTEEIRWGRIIALELAALFTLGLFAAFSGNDLIAADAGKYGGRLGWGMVELVRRYMGAIFGTLVILILWMLTVATGFGLWTRLESWLLKFAGETPPEVVPNPIAESKPEVVESSPEPEKSTTAPPKKKAPHIPPEFRTSSNPRRRRMRSQPSR